MENWRNIPGKDSYQISIDTKEGKCRSLNYRNVKGKVKELSNNHPAGKYINWNIAGVVKQAAVWIAVTYPELVQNEYFEGAEIDHIDTDPTNNHPENLRWVTHKENENNILTKQHISESNKGRKLSYEHVQKIISLHKGVPLSEEHRKKISESNTGKHVNRTDQSKPVEQYTKEGVYVGTYPSAAEAARVCNLSKANICNCCRGVKYVKTVGNYIWKYA